MHSDPPRCTIIANCKTSETLSILDRPCPRAAHVQEYQAIPVPNDQSLRCTNVWKQKALKINSSCMAEKRRWSAGRRTKAVRERNQRQVVGSKLKGGFQQTRTAIFKLPLRQVLVFSREFGARLSAGARRGIRSACDLVVLSSK